MSSAKPAISQFSSSDADAGLRQQSLRNIQACSRLALAFGILFRLVQYFSNRSLWLDEALVVLNLQERSYSQLLEALDYNQAAPPFFLWIEKFALENLGNTEYSLRLYPLIGGLLSLVIFYQFTKSYAEGWVRPIAIFLFSTLSYIAYYSSEVKPYSWDITICLLLFMSISGLVGPFKGEGATLKPSLKKTFVAALLGVVSVWLSFPSILVMAGTEATNLIKLKLWRISRSDWLIFLSRRVPLYVAWLLSFGALYAVNISKTLTGTTLESAWADRYPKGWFDVIWLLDAFGQFFYHPLGFFSPADGIALVVFVVGWVYLYRTHKWRLAYLSSPFAITIIASYLQQYPFRNRLILFTTPYALVILAHGISLLIRRFFQGKTGRSAVRSAVHSVVGERQKESRSARVVRVVGFVLSLSLLILPLTETVPKIVLPQRNHFDHVRPAIAYIRTHWQPGDKLYISPAARRLFQYYRSRFDFPEDDVVFGEVKNFGSRNLAEGALERLTENINGLKTGPFKGQTRVWLLHARKPPDEEAMMLKHLDDTVGKSMETVHYPKAVVSLRDLSDDSSDTEH
ncbi:MAG: hypothetical protein AAGN15_06765 [Cyanobacteria bacterium J06581_3]